MVLAETCGPVDQLHHAILVTNTTNNTLQDELKVPPHGTQRTIWWRNVMLVAVLALAVRLFNVWSTTEVPTTRHLIGDAAGYYEWSQKIAAGEWVGNKGFYQAPLYPYAMAVWHLFGSTSVLGIRILQAFWGSAACVLLCVATSRMFCARVGLLSGLMLAFYGPAIYFDGIIQKASLDCLLVCAVLSCIAVLATRRNLRWSALLGAAVSLLCLTRENAIAWHLILPVWLFWWSASEAVRRISNGEDRTTESRSDGANSLPRPRRLKSAARNVLAYLLGAAITLFPVGLRNFYMQREFALTTSKAGPNFYIGNNRQADGRYQPLVRGHETPTFEQRDATGLAEQSAGRQLTPHEVSRFWMQRAWSEIAADPIGWLKLSGYKILLVGNQYEIADAESIAIYRRHSPVLSALCTVWHFGVLATLAVLGIALTWNARRRLWIFYALIVTMTLAVAAFYVLARYRYPLVPLLIPFAATGCIELWRRRTQWHTLKGPLTLAIVSAIIFNWPIQDEKRLDALAEMNAGVALAQGGEIEDAAEYFTRAVANHPTSAEANYNLALALAVQGKFSEAMPFYEETIQSQFDLVGAHFNLAVALEQTGEAQEALKHFEIAIQQDSGDTEARAAITRLQQKDTDPPY